MYSNLKRSCYKFFISYSITNSQGNWKSSSFFLQSFTITQILQKCQRANIAWFSTISTMEFRLTGWHELYNVGSPIDNLTQAYGLMAAPEIYSTWAIQLVGSYWIPVYLKREGRRSLVSWTHACPCTSSSTCSFLFFVSLCLILAPVLLLFRFLQCIT